MSEESVGGATTEQQSSDEVKRLHFVTETDPSPTLRCRIFGHNYVTGTARTEPFDGDEFEIDVCGRCMSIEGRTWEGIASFQPDGDSNE